LNDVPTASPSPEDPRRVGLLVLFLAALFVRLLFLVLEPQTRLLGDERTWIALGLQRVAAPPVSFNPLRSSLIFYPPLHPYLIGAVNALFGGLTAVKVLQALFGALLVPVVARIGTRAFGARAGFAAALMTAFYPTLIWYSVHFWSEPLFVLLLWWGLERVLASDAPGEHRTVAVGGLILGFAALTREPPLYFLPLLAAWVLLRDGWRKPARAVVLVLAALTVVAPWTLRNAVRFDAFIPVSTMGGRALWEGNTERPRDHIYAEYDAVGRAEGPAAQHRHAVREGLRALWERQPGWLLDKAVHEIPDLLTPDNMPLVHINKRGYGRPRTTVAWGVAAVTVVPYLLVMTLFVLGLARLTWSRPKALLLLFLGFYVAIHVVVHGHHRFRIPMLPGIFVIAASALPGATSAARLTGRRGLLALALMVLLGLCLIPGFLGFFEEFAYVDPPPAGP
jgi:4-amino-4-deoxy-L-arabinose transferase-like glycosyltransferase